MRPNYIIVQAGGKGTRLEHLTRNKPKALVPVGNRPMIFHLFEKYPEQKYFIIGDYKLDVLCKYLKAFAKVDYTIIDAHGKCGTCAGLKKSLSQIPDGESFLLVWCDLVLPMDFQFPDDNANYVGISKGFPCRWSYKKGKFQEEPSREHGVAGLFLFHNRESISDVPDEGEFVRWLGGGNLTFRELPLYQTKEYGLLEDYQKLGERKCRPFNRITVEGDTVIKEAVDEQGAGLARRERAWYAEVMDRGFPNIPKIYSLEPLRMERIEGKNIFEYDLTRKAKRQVLEELIRCLRLVHGLGECAADPDSYDDAYIRKTFKRLDKVWDLVPFARDKTITINGKECPNVLYHRAELEEQVRKYQPKSFRFLHGDCTFSNTLLRKGRQPVLIDPRGYFGVTELYGDPAYDWAKLYYSVVGNYDQFNLKRFSLSIGEKDVKLEIASNHWEDMEPDFFELLGTEACPEQIKLFHAIIWLSLTTYAWEDYDSVCGAFYKGIACLNIF